MKHCPLFLLLVFLATGCATQTTPSGGPKDETAPTLVSAQPKDNQTNFKGKEIELTFSELIKLKNPKEEIIIIPPVGKKTEFQARKNKLIIIPETAWKENTTYAINFREGVQDMTEGNPVANLRLAFSTGDYIDSLKIEGNVADALSEKIPLAITVAIYEQDTFNIFEHTPSYFTKTTEDGKFTIGNLKSGSYKLYAFNDKNKNLKVDSKNESYAFRAQPITLQKNSAKNELRLVSLDSRPFKLNGARAQADVNTIRLNKAATDFKIQSSQKLLTDFGSDHTELIAYFPTINEDSLQVRVSATDSLLQKIDTLIYIKKNANERLKSSFAFTSSDIKLNADTRILTAKYRVNKRIASFNLDSIYVMLDTTTRVPVKTEHLTYDTINRRLNLRMPIPLQNEKKITLKTGKGFLISIENDSSKRDSKNATEFNTETTGVLLVEIKTKEPNFIVELLEPSGEVIETRVNESKPVFKYLEPQNIKLRVIIDRNKNGIWDTSNIFQNIEPEKVIYYQTPDKKYETPIRANWEVGPLIISF